MTVKLYHCLRARSMRPLWTLEEMGIDIGDRWPVIMAGYIVNSLNRSADEIRQTPYRPRSGDEFFPTRYQDVEEETTSPS